MANKDIQKEIRSLDGAIYAFYKANGGILSTDCRLFGNRKALSGTGIFAVGVIERYRYFDQDYI